MSPWLRPLLFTLASLALPACSSDSAVGVAQPTFEMRSPSKASIGVASVPTFSWNPLAETTSYNLQVSSDSGFSAIVLNQSGIVGTSTSPGLALLPASVYYWRVIAVRPAGDLAAIGSPWSFTTVAPVPGAFTLIAPIDGTTGASTRPTFSWTASLGAASYRFQISTDSTLSAVLVEQAGLLTTSLTLTVPLMPATRYYWRVLAESSSVTFSSGSSWSFTTASATPGPFTLVSPVGTATAVSTLPTFVWNVAAGALSYRLQVATDLTFTVMLLDQAGITTTNVTPSLLLLPLATYYWRVYAVNAGGTTLGTPAPASFITI